MNSKTLRRSAAALALGLAAATAPAAVGATTASAAPYCGITWGSLAKTNQTMNATTLTGLRAGRHACFDRLVIDHKGKATGYDVRYVSVVTQDGSGFPVPVAGGAALQVVDRAARYTTAPAMPNVTGFTTFRQVKWAGSFEGQSTVALGVRARLPFRAFTINDTATGTSRLVIDVAHQW
ncbi:MULTISPECIES: AMIN-like domain-containing (lipo)protein [unclassified Knoellia]|uniref:AMIN-like domain-containing (lipo)protein n=1 Tax=Knoellia altitudinis TaxID=3404795 RepID=UPI00361DCC9F